MCELEMEIHSKEVHLHRERVERLFSYFKETGRVNVSSQSASTVWTIHNSSSSSSSIPSLTHSLAVIGSLNQPTRISLLVRRNNNKMESQISVRQSMLDKMKRPFKNNRRLNRYWNSVQLNLTRNSGYYALVSSLMCLCLIGLRSNGEYHDHDEIDSELHYSFHNWEPKVKSFQSLIAVFVQRPFSLSPSLSFTHTRFSILHGPLKFSFVII